MIIRNRKSSGRGELLVPRTALMTGTLAIVALGYVLSGVGSYEALLILGVLCLVVGGGVVGFSRVRARERWEAAWDAYAAQEGSRDPIRPYQEEGTLSMAGAR
jgi:hypothetical protein